MKAIPRQVSGQVKAMVGLLWLFALELAALAGPSAGERTLQCLQPSPAQPAPAGDAAIGQT